MIELPSGGAGLHSSHVQHNDATFWMTQDAHRKLLAVRAPTTHHFPIPFDGEPRALNDNRVLTLCPLTAHNARALRAAVPWLKPVRLGLQTSAGFGDRLGLATVGHIRALRAARAENLAPIFAQQSIRENARTGRTPPGVLDDATWGAFQAGWKSAVGADADHLKTTDDLDACVAAEYSFYTIDPGEYVNSAADRASATELRHFVDLLPWQELEGTPRDLATRYAGKTVRLETRNLKPETDDLLRAAAKYGRALAHVAKMYRHLTSTSVEFELEVSVDETETPTTHVEHYYFASELKRLGVPFISLAPRYSGRFEKGVDYIGDLDAFERDLAVHAEIARCLGPYKLSLHSGSDKFSVYEIAMRQARGLVHLKTAGTSYLEALRTVAQIEPELLRAIYAFAREHYAADRATYHVSAQLARAPLGDALSDADLPALLNQFDARQILHVTYGSVLNARDATGKARFKEEMMAFLRANEDAYAANLEKHFVRHLKPFAANNPL
ncbi:MAG: hypothetical protein HY741_10320 [Chloroflexi bacterium]|nr:hypothetical protein [Chloroflexota bacterium]